MQVIRILRRVAAHQRDVDRARLLVDMLDAAHVPRALGHAALDLTRRDIDELDVVPPAALGHPQELALRVEPVHPDLVRVVDEGRIRLLGDGARGARRKIDRHEAHDLVPALVVEEREFASARDKARAVERPRSLEQRGLDRDLPRRQRRAAGRALDAKEMRHGPVDLVAGLRVLERLELGLEAVLRRGLDDVHGVRRAALDAHHDHGVARGRDPLLAPLLARRRGGRAKELRLSPAEDKHIALAPHAHRVGLDLAALRLLRFILPIEQIDGHGFARAGRVRRRGMFALDHRGLLDIRGDDMAEDLAAQRLDHPRVAAERLLPALGARRDAAVALLVAARIDPDDLDGLVEVVREVDAARRPLPAAARGARLELQLQRLRGVGIDRARRAAGEIEHERLVDALKRHDHTSTLDGDTLHRQAIGGALGGGRRGGVIEQRGLCASAILRRVHQPPPPRAVLRGLAVPKPRSVDPGARPDGVVIELGLRVDPRARRCDPLAHFLKRRAGRRAGRRGGRNGGRGCGRS